MRASLITDALNMARLHGHLQPNAISRSDQGTQFASAEFCRQCKKIDVRRSMCRTGVCRDKGAAETLLATLKNEMHYRQSFATKARARFALAEYIEVFYNRKRMHSSIGYCTPARALNAYRTAAQAP